MESSKYRTSSSQFPPVEHAQEDGLLAIGGDLSPERLIDAYRHGIFPWFNENDPLLWWSPDPRMVLFTDKVKISRSLRKTINKSEFIVSFDKAFTHVMSACAAPRKQTVDKHETWIHANMIEAYSKLHHLGIAHSVEVWQNDELVGGLYGVALGKIFFGESMFSKQKDTSKIALVALCKQLQRWNFPLIDCQIYSQHLESMGAKTIARSDFINYLDTHCETGAAAHLHWNVDKDLFN